MTPQSQKAFFALLPYTQEIASGVESYWEEHPECEGNLLGWLQPEVLDMEPVYGFITMVAHPDDFIVTESRLRGFPLVNTSNRSLAGVLPSVVSDDVEVGRVAARYLLKRGYREFLYIAEPTAAFSTEREAGFRQELQSAGCEVVTHNFPGLLGETPPPAEFDRQLESLVSICLQEGKSRPVRAVLGYSSDGIQKLLKNGWKHFGATVGQIGWLGVDAPFGNLMEVREMRISAVRPDFSRIGYEAAALLAQLMSGAVLQNLPLRIAPLGVVEGTTTPGAVKGDAVVAMVLKWIDQDLRQGERVSVSQSAARANLSPRTLQRRFREALGVGVKEQIVARRLQLAADLLCSSPATITEISLQVGYHSPSEFSRRFRTVHGMSPRDWRNLHLRPQ